MLSIFKKALVASVAIAGLATLSRADTTLTFYVQYNDNGTNTYTAPTGTTGHYAIYISDATTSGTSGINFGVAQIIMPVVNALTADVVLPRATYAGLSGGAGFMNIAKNNTGAGRFEIAASPVVDPTTQQYYYVGGMGISQGSLPSTINGGARTVVAPAFADFGTKLTDSGSLYALCLVTGTYDTTSNAADIDYGATTAGVFYDSAKLGSLQPLGGNPSAGDPADPGYADSVVYRTLATTIPEPASLGVLALGGLALLARRRKVA